MNKDEALYLALEALGLYQAAGFGNSTDFNKQHEAFYKAQTAIIAIKQARADHTDDNLEMVAAPVQPFDHQQAANTALRESMNRSVAIAKNTVPTAYKRPQNCGTGYCSCVECVMEPAPVQEPVLKDNSNYRYDPPVAEPVQSCYCPNCEAAAQPAPVQDKVTLIQTNVGIGERAMEAYEAAKERDRADFAAPTVQEPFGYLEIEDIESHSEYPHNCRNVNLWHEGGEGMVAIYITPPAAQRRIEELEAQLMQMQGRELKLQMALNTPAAQRQWVGLTDEEMHELVDRFARYELARAIEARLKELNT